MLARPPESPGARHAGNLRILAGLIGAALVLGGAATMALQTAGEWMDPSAALAATEPAKSPPPAPQPAPAKSPAPAPAPPATSVPRPASVPATNPAVMPLKAPPAAAAKKPGAAPATGSALAKAPPSSPGANAPAQAVAPVVAASARPSVVTVKPGSKVSGALPGTHLEEQQTYQYNALGRRDPFQPLIGGGFVGDDVGGDAPPDIGGLKVVGIVWGTNDKFALVEDARGNSLVLRQGDKVMNGIVQGLKRDAVMVSLTVDGQATTVAIPLTRKGENSNANR